MEKRLMLGNEAIARGFYEGGGKVASSYPGTPSTEITEYISKYEQIYSEWAPNEKVSLEVCAGASFGGVRSLCAMKHVGLNVAADPLFTMSYTGVRAGQVIVVADDPGMLSSQNEQDSRHYAKAAKIMMLEPADSSECKEYVKQGLDLSEQFDTPVLIRLTTRIAHSQSPVEICDRQEKTIIPYEKQPGKYVMMPAMARVRHKVVEDRQAQISRWVNTTPLNQMTIKDTKIGVITSGVCYQYAKEALETASVLKLGVVYPLPEQLIREFCQKVEKVYVIEELDPHIEEFVRALGVDVVGKEIFPIMGELSPDIIRQAIEGETVGSGQKQTMEFDIPPRPPVMCTGCPHRGLHYVLKKLGLIVSGDIGCYTLGALPPLATLDTCLCMGASVSMAHGMSKAQNPDFAGKTVAILGDSTFIHSGITGLIDIVYNKGNATVLILDNSITGMTGHQHNPSTGKTIKGEPTVQVDFELLCRAIGVQSVVVADPFDINSLEDIIKQEVGKDQPSVVIVRRPCALLPENKPMPVVSIDQGKCTKCKMCMRIGCPSISIKSGSGDGRKNYTIEIDATQCRGCGLCKSMCKFGAIS